MKIHLLLATYLSTCLFSNGVTYRPQKFVDSMTLAATFSSHYSQENLPKNNSEQKTNTWVKKVIEERIQTEVNHTFRRITPLLNTWLVIILMLSTATVSGTWLLLVKLAQQIKICREEIDTLKYDTIAHITYLASDAAIVANGIQEHLKVAQQQIHRLKAETILLSENEHQPNLEPPTE